MGLARRLPSFCQPTWSPFPHPFHILGSTHRQQSSSSNPMSKSTIQISKHTNSKSAQRLTDLRVTRKATRGEEVDEVAGEGDQDHDGGLLPFCLVDGAEAHSEEGDEEEADLGVMLARGHYKVERLGEWGRGEWRRHTILRHRLPTCNIINSIPIHRPIKRRSNCDSKPQKQGINHRIKHPHTSRHDTLTLQFQRTTEDYVTRQYQRDG